MSRILCIAIAVLALSAPAAVAASPPPKLIAASVEDLWTFDGRYVAWRKDGAASVLDMRTGATHVVGIPCTPRDASSGRLACWGDTLWSMSRRKPLPAPSPRVWSYDRIGRYWASGCSAPVYPQCQTRAYANLRTGEVRAFEDFDFRDLDDPDLGVLDPFTLTDRGYVIRFSYESGPLILRTPAGKELTLDNCAINRGCAAVALSAGVVTWSSGSRHVRAYNVRTGRRYSWPVKPTFGVSSRGLGVNHGRYGILVWATAPNRPGSLFRLPLP